jgi:hypothetical protein
LNQVQKDIIEDVYLLLSVRLEMISFDLKLLRADA